MVSRDNKIKADYAKRLKDAKTNRSTSSPDSDIDQGINFGCLRLEGFIADFVKPGMTVIDFGSGPGHDLFLAARAAAPNGRAIGVDMTEEMITEVKETARKRGIENVETVKSRIEDIPLPDRIADVIISNCVICISSNKESVFKEAFRLLKPGGVLLDADLIANRVTSAEACTGALSVDEHEQILRKIGFDTVSVKRGSKDLVTHEQDGVYSGLISARKPVD
ncbi:MAG: methyltransferase domain-containing protein [Candidatus Hodarchaeales archaeon]|jgi:ubiquinone/menaquinone biosynthesis C-methylase UbiE